jgi:hypothetical protein
LRLRDGGATAALRRRDDDDARGMMMNDDGALPLLPIAGVGAYRHFSDRCRLASDHFGSRIAARDDFGAFRITVFARKRPLLFP